MYQRWHHRRESRRGAGDHSYHSRTLPKPNFCSEFPDSWRSVTSQDALQFLQTYRSTSLLVRIRNATFHAPDTEHWYTSRNPSKACAPCSWMQICASELIQLMVTISDQGTYDFSVTLGCQHVCKKIFQDKILFHWHDINFQSFSSFSYDALLLIPYLQKKKTFQESACIRLKTATHHRNKAHQSLLYNTSD